MRAPEVSPGAERVSGSTHPSVPNLADAVATCMTSERKARARRRWRPSPAPCLTLQRLVGFSSVAVVSVRTRVVAVADGIRASTRANAMRTEVASALAAPVAGPHRVTGAHEVVARAPLSLLRLAVPSNRSRSIPSAEFRTLSMDHVLLGEPAAVCEMFTPLFAGQERA